MVIKVGGVVVVGIRTRRLVGEEESGATVDRDGGGVNPGKSYNSARRDSPRGVVGIIV